MASELQALCLVAVTFSVPHDEFDWLQLPRS